MGLNRITLGHALAVACTLALAGCGGSGYGGSSYSGGSGGSGGGYGGGGNTPTGPAYVATGLVSDGSSTTYHDANLVDGWGIAFNPQGFVWITNNGTSTSTLYDGNGVPQQLVVKIPAGTAGNAASTGIVFNGTQDFKVSQSGVTAASPFLFVGEAGTLSGWSPSVNLNAAVTVYDGGSAGKVYKGLATGAQGTANFLYAADFHGAHVDVFDGNFNLVSVAGGFQDKTLPAGFAPFGIQAIGGQIFVAYAKQDSAAHDEVHGAGLGQIDVFDTSGNLIKTLVTGGPLNAPWGMAVAPANFGPFSNALLVANFGDGKINAFDPTSGAFLGTLNKADGTPVVEDGLWGIAFGNGLNNQPVNTLFFTAGPAGESHGLYGRIDYK